MTVLDKERYIIVVNELNKRVDELRKSLKCRGLDNSSEGTKKGTWRYPDDMVATVGNNMRIRLAVDDFKTILAEIKKLT